MKRVKSACITQTLHFSMKDDMEHDYAVKLINEEVKRYKKQLEKNNIKYKVLSETTQEDGSIIMEIIKQYNSSPTGDYIK